MRAVIQRVARASVEVDGTIVSAISGGLCVFVGLSRDDTPDDMNYIARKILNTRIFEDDAGNMNHSIQDIAGEILLVSQFTLYGDMRKGNRPSFTQAMPAEEAQKQFELFCRLMSQQYEPVVTGVFQAHMMIDLVNDGPVTILLDSTRQF